MLTILLALISHVAWGSGDILGTIATRKIGGIKTAFWFWLVLFPIYGLMSLFSLNSIKDLTLQVFLLNVALGAVGIISMVTFYEGLRIGKAPIVNTISASFVALTVILSIIFLGETITFFQFLAIAIIMTGIIVSTLDFGEIKKRGFEIDKSILLALATMILWGIYWTFIKIPVKEIGWILPNFIAVLPFPILLVYMKIRKINVNFEDIKKLPMILVLNAVLLGLGATAFNLAIAKGGSVAIITPIASSYPALYAILSYFIFKDKITPREIFGIILTLTGIISLSIFSV